MRVRAWRDVRHTHTHIHIQSLVVAAAVRSRCARHRTKRNVICVSWCVWWLNDVYTRRRDTQTESADRIL